MKRQERKNLKSDKFAEEFGHGFEFITEHKAESIRYGSIALALILIAVGTFYYRRHEATAREQALAAALHIDNATVANASPPPGTLNFTTQAEKDKAREKAFSDLEAKYPGTQEGAMAGMYLASDAVDQGDMAAAEKRFKMVMDNAPKAYASKAKLALAQVYAGEGKTADAEKLLRDLIAHPTITVSKDEATIQLALVTAQTNRTEAVKMLTPLQNSRTAVSRATVQALGQISQLAPNK
ncbi:MAG: tetratricopeptide repeat protein [Bryobacteraceae bacterium]